MRVSLETLLDKLGIHQEMHAYDSYPISISDAKGVTVNAEARMNEDATELETQADITRDNPGPEEKDFEIAFMLRFTVDTHSNWTPHSIRVKGEDKKSVYAWEEKGCDFFKMLLNVMRRGEFPDIDELIEEAFNRNERFSDQYGGGTSKAPKIKPGQLLDMKQGRGF